MDQTSAAQRRTMRISRRVNPARSRAGFTLLEILVVVLIITILATIVGVKVVDKPGQARVAATKAQLVGFRSALQVYHMQNSMYPTQEQGLEALCRLPTTPPVPASYPDEGYLDTHNLPLDQWGRPYVYLVPGTDNQPYEVISYGSDGEPGGTGDAADISTAAM
ncbi:MAG: type II secretion system major pseudopilin GspG [Lentisphaerae bacterium]|nr:type II secretion system major pseudopilin GspG [Lentisphaerota bacterium]